MNVRVMPPRWKIVSRKECRGFEDSLEERARRIAEDMPGIPGAGAGAEDWDGMPGATLEREIALTVGQLDRVREVHRTMMDRLLQMEVYVDTELMMVESSTISYAASNPQKSHDLKDKLLRLEAERQRQTLVYEDKVHKLHERLLVQVNRLTTLDP